jgi:hypothetical protein
MQILPFDEPVINNASAYSTWVQTTESDFNNGNLINLTVNSSGYVELIHYNDFVTDDFNDISKINIIDKVILNTTTDELVLNKKNTTFAKIVYNGTHFQPFSIQQTPDEGYIISGNGLIKTDKFGNYEWKKPLSGGLYTSLELTKDGGFITSGYEQQIYSDDISLIKTNNTGDIQWQQNYGNLDYDDWGWSVKETQDNGFVIAGYTKQGFAPTQYDIIILKANSTGDEEWNTTYDKTDWDWGQDVIQKSNGNYILLGDVEVWVWPGPVLERCIWLAEVNSAGNTLWEKTYGGIEEEFAGSVIETPDGGYLIVGGEQSYCSVSGAYNCVWLIKTNSIGTKQWDKIYHFETYTGWPIYEIHNTTDGGYIISGGTDYVPFGSYKYQEFLLLKIDSSGNEQWNRTFGGYEDDDCFSSKQTTDGGYILVGYSDSYTEGGYNTLLIKTDGLGYCNYSGLISSKNLLIDQNSSLISTFNCSVILPINTSIQIQFSNDNKYWYNSSGSSFGWDSLSNGYNTFNLTSLGWNGSNFYYRMNFVSLDIENVPKLQNINLSYKKYVTIGTLESQSFNTGGKMSWKKIDWSSTNPQETEIKFQIRTASTQSGLNSKSFVGPDGTSSTFYSVSGTSLWSGHANDQWIQFKTFFITSNVTFTPVLHDVTISFNYWPNTPLLNTPSNNTWTNNNKPTFGWTFSDTDSSSQSAFQMQLDDANDFSSIYHDYGEITSTQLSHKPSNSISDGTWYWRVRVKDSDGDWSSYSKSRIIKIDSAIDAPINVTVVPDTWTSINSFDISWENPNEVSGIIGGYYKLYNEPTSNIDGIQFSGDNICDLNDIKVVGEYSHKIYIWLEDRAGNINYQNYGTATIYYDKTPPLKPNNMIAEPSGWSSINNFTVSWDNPNELSGIAGAFYSLDIEPVPGTIGTYIEGDDINSIKNIEVDGDGKHEIYIWLKDKAGNYYYDNYNNISFYLDSSAPGKPTKLNVAPGTWTINNSFDISWQNPNELSGIKGVYYKMDSEPTSNTDGSYISGDEINLIEEKSVDSDGEHKIYIWLVDAVGNVNYYNHSSAKLLYDSLSPVPPINITIKPDSWTSENSFTIDWEYPYDYSGVKNGAYYCLGNDPPFSQLNGIWTSKKPFTITDVPEGVSYIYIWLEDNLGNKNHLNYSIGSFKLDITPPRSLSISINDDSTITNNLTVTLTLDALDKLSGVYQMSFSTDNDLWTDWKEFSNIKILTLPPDEGIKKVYFRVIDYAGNIANPVSDKIQYEKPKEDTDGDGYPDEQDAFPEDPNEWKDTDGDNYGDNSDIFPYDPNEWLDSDHDSYGDNKDAFPNDPDEWKDKDKDNIGDNEDDDDDNDGISDNKEDANGNGRVDDGETNPLDPDTDDDGHKDGDDDYPLDSTRWEREKDVSVDINWVLIILILFVIIFGTIFGILFLKKPKTKKKAKKKSIEDLSHAKTGSVNPSLPPGPSFPAGPLFAPIPEQPQFPYQLQQPQKSKKSSIQWKNEDSKPNEKSLKITKLIHEGTKAYEEERYRDSIIAFQEVLIEEPDSHPDIRILVKEALRKSKVRRKDEDSKPNGKSSKIKKLIHEGTKAYEEERYRDSIIAFQEVLIEEPDSHPDIRILVKEALKKTKF